MSDSPLLTTNARRIELHGHIIDSGVLSRVMVLITEHPTARYTIEELVAGQHIDEESYARLAVQDDDPVVLEELLDRLRDAGALVNADLDAAIAAAPADGIVPDDFYATSNMETEVRIAGTWQRVESPEMDCAIVVDENGPRTIAFPDVHAGDAIVVGHAGVRVHPPQRARRKAVFEFMASSVSSEKPRASLVGEIARELIATRAGGKRVLVVGGPAIVHTGAGHYLAELIRDGYVDALFAGNALAVHDIEAQFFGTSLGVNLHDALQAEEGHVHHLRTVNRLRAAGGIRGAIASGMLRGGIMYEAYRREIPVVLAGSIRDDGPIPDVITDVIEAQRAMRAYVPEVGMALMICTLLHSIAVGNLLPATCKTVCVDINPASVTKLTDRGSQQTLGVVMDAASFLRELSLSLQALAE